MGEGAGKGRGQLNQTVAIQSFYVLQPDTTTTPLIAEDRNESPKIRGEGAGAA